MKSINVVFYLFINFTFQGSTGSLFLKIRQHVYLELVFKMMLIKPQICQQISFVANLLICFLDNLFTKCLYECIQISNYERLQWSYALHKIVHAYFPSVCRENTRMIRGISQCTVLVDTISEILAHFLLTMLVHLKFKYISNL